MANVNITLALDMVKARLNRTRGDDSLDGYIVQRIGAAMDELEGTGIHLRDTTGDLMLVVDMTVWQYQSRDKPGGMPDWLRLRRRERWLQERKGETANDP